jgi:hypothetical protein
MNQFQTQSDFDYDLFTNPKLVFHRFHMLAAYFFTNRRGTVN